MDEEEVVVVVVVGRGRVEGMIWCDEVHGIPSLVISKTAGDVEDLCGSLNDLSKSKGTLLSKLMVQKDHQRFAALTLQLCAIHSFGIQCLFITEAEEEQTLILETKHGINEMKEDGSVELHKSAGLRDRGVKKDQDHRDRDRDRDRDRLSRSKRKRTDEMIGFSVGKGNAEVALSLVGYDQELKDGKCAETDDILPDGFKLKKGDGVYYMSYAMGRGCLTFGEMMQKISDLKDGSTMVFSNLNHRSNSSHFMYIYSILFFFCLQKRLYMLIFISGKNKNENLEMERVIEFPHTHMDRRPRKTPRLGWDIAPQALKEGATKEDIEQLPKYKFRRIGDFEKQNGEIQESFGGIIRECDTDSAIEHVFSPENATTVVLAVDVAFVYCAIYTLWNSNVTT
ncbi:hypothetical protein ACSBR1_028000 [Camellia fascicularis]